MSLNRRGTLSLQVSGLFDHSTAAFWLERNLITSGAIKFAVPHIVRFTGEPPSCLTVTFETGQKVSAGDANVSGTVKD